MAMDDSTVLTLREIPFVVRHNYLIYLILRKRNPLDVFDLSYVSFNDDNSIKPPPTF